MTNTNLCIVVLKIANKQTMENPEHCIDEKSIMPVLEIDFLSREAILKSFDQIAEKLFKGFQLHVNKSLYRLVDIEFYYFSKNIYEDVYTHKHKDQLQNGKWYFHSSGIDITFGNGINHGGILIRAIAKISSEASKDKYFIEKEIHGPLNVKTEICSNFNGVFEKETNIFQLKEINGKMPNSIMYMPIRIIKTKRIGLNPEKGNSQKFYDEKLRYIIFPHLKLRDKSQIALDMRKQFSEMTNAEINKELGSTFLK
jgi:hypothetical protein